MTSLREGGNEYIPKGSAFVQADLCKGKTRHKGHKMQVKTKKSEEVTVSANCHLFKRWTGTVPMFPSKQPTVKNNSNKKQTKKNQPQKTTHTKTNWFCELAI